MLGLCHNMYFWKAVQPTTRYDGLSDRGYSCRLGLLMANCNGVCEGRSLDGVTGGEPALSLGLVSEKVCRTRLVTTGEWWSHEDHIYSRTTPSFVGFLVDRRVVVGSGSYPALLPDHSTHYTSATLFSLCLKRIPRSFQPQGRPIASDSCPRASHGCPWLTTDSSDHLRGHQLGEAIPRQHS